MLRSKYDQAFLHRWLVARERWPPYPKAADRAAWRGLPMATRMALLNAGRQSLKQAWPVLPAMLFLDFARTGNRARFETPWFERRSILNALTLAECVEARGRFLDPIADALWSICEESSWCFPAHIGIQRAGSDLPDTTEPIVDLFAAETGAQLAWTLYLLEDALGKVSPLIAPRIVREIGQRILDPCLARNDFWWMGFRKNTVNNWNPWINSNWLACALLCEPDPDRRIEAVAKSIRSVDNFIDPYPADGGCDEGPSYWTRAGASLFDYLDLLYRATRGRADVYREPKIREIGRFIYRAHLADNWFLNFADAPAVMRPPAGLVFRFGQRTGDRPMQALARSFRDAKHAAASRGHGPLTRVLPDLFECKELYRGSAAAPLPRDVWLPDTQVMLARQAAGSTRGLTLAAKGGHNAESHNHNDVGHFVVLTDGMPLLVDVGVGTYTRKTFSRERYSIWTMQSQYHNLPTIDGIMQRAGREFQALNPAYRTTRKETVLELDIAAAYPKEAGLVSWRRTFAFMRGGDIRLSDSYSAKKQPRKIIWNFMTPCKATAGRGKIRFVARMLPGNRSTGRGWLSFDPRRLRARVEMIRGQDDRLAAAWGDHLFRVRLEASHPQPTDQYEFTISS